MDRELARHVLEVGFNSGRLLEDLIPLIQNHCQKKESEQYIKAIASVLAEIGLEIFSKIYDQYPDLKKEVEDKVQRYGKFL
ncbi:MAG: hypothetical protein WAV02_22525 [Stellaceae bacterium]